MPDRTYEFVQLDVFTQTPLTGNPLAIFTDARGLDDGEMQAVAREMNLSETTFILPRDPATEAREGKKVRIFTVAEELPFAGHPTLGTALHLYASQFSPGSEQSAEITLDLKAGKIPVHFTANSENAGRNRVDGQVFGEMRQRDPEFGVTLSRERSLACLESLRPRSSVAYPIGVDRVAFYDCGFSQPGDAGESKVPSFAGRGISEEQRRQVFLFSLSGTARQRPAGSPGAHVFLRR